MYLPRHYKNWDYLITKTVYVQLLVHRLHYEIIKYIFYFELLTISIFLV